MALDQDSRDAWGVLGDNVSKDWLIHILLEMYERIVVLEDEFKRLKENPNA
jgi:uncharacterized small protein (DUF1192 family)